MSEQLHWNYGYTSSLQQYINRVQAWARGEARDINDEMCRGDQYAAMLRLTTDVNQARMSGSQYSEGALKNQLHERGITTTERPLMSENGHVYVYIAPVPELNNDAACKITNSGR